MRKTLVILLTPLTLFLIFAFVYDKYLFPYLENLAKTEIREYSIKNLPVTIEIDHLNIYFLRPSISVSEIRVTPKKELEGLLSPIVISETRAFLDIFKLIVGRLEVSFVAIEKIAMTLQVDPLLEGPSKPQRLPLKNFLKILEKLPLNQVILKNSEIKINSAKNHFTTDLNQTDLFLGKIKHGLDLVLKVPQTELRLEEKKLKLSLGLDATLVDESLKLHSAYLNIDENQIQLSGDCKDFAEVQIDPQFSYKLKSAVHLASAQANLIEVFKNLPSLQGSIELESEGELKKNANLENHFSIKTKEVSVGKFIIGSADLKGEIKENRMSMSNISVEHPSGHAILQQSQLALNPPYEFKTKILASQFSLSKLFDSIDLPEVPVELLAHGEASCRGQLTRGFMANCDASIESNYLMVAAGKSPRDKKIIEIEEIKAKGNLDFNVERLLFTSDLQLKTSKGKAQGEVKFKEGFAIGFSSDPIDFNEVKELGGLKYQGQFSLNGLTKGSSQGATFESHTKAQNFYLDDYRLGNLNTFIKYEKGHLTFTEAVGALNQTEYAGFVDLNFKAGQIEGEIKSKNANLADVQLVIENKLKIPIDFKGIGPLEIYFDGPLNFWKMNLKVQSHFLKGSIGPDSFDRLQANLHQKGPTASTSSDQKNEGATALHFDDVYVLKNRSRMNLTGDIQGETEKWNLKLNGTGLRIEESELVGRLSSSLFGNLNIIGDLTGTFKDPITKISGTLTDTVIEDQEFPSSFVELKILKTYLEGQANILGNKIQTEFRWPFQKGSESFLLKLKTINWSFASMLSLIGAHNLQSQYETALTSDIDLHSETGDPLKSSGRIIIDQLLLRRGDLSFKNKEPMSANFTNGHGRLKNFVLEGPQNLITIEGEDFSPQNLDLTVQANASLRLLHVFVPFLEELNGKLDLSARLAGRLDKPEIFGTAKVNEAFIKLKGFPHSIEKLDGDLSFSHSKIQINNLKGQLSGGLISGDGQILINGLRELPTNVKLKLQGVNLQVPDHVKSSGNGELLFSGSWFPFTLSGVYNITSAFIDKDFGGEEAANLSAKQSIYLPKSLKENSFEPLLLDLQVLISKNAVIKNKLVDGSFTGDLQVKGPPSSPLLFGKVNLDKGSRLNFRDKIFEVQTGLLQFNDTKEINPELYISANSRVNEYDVNLLVQGPSKSLVVKTTSSPPLSEQDIFSLLALGVTSTKLDQSYSSNTQQQQTGYEIGSAIISQSGLDRQLRDKLGVTFQFGSSFDSTKNITVPKITISRNIRKKLDASFSRTLGEQNVNEARLQYSINNNVSAIGSWQGKEVQEGTTTKFNEKETEILGVDLEYKKEFK